MTDAEADAYFASRPRGSRVGAWASPQSRVIADRAELDALVRAIDERFPGEDVPRPATGAASASRPPRSSSGRAGRAGSTIACATAARAGPGRSSAWRPDPYARVDSPRRAPARRRRPACGSGLRADYTLPMLSTVPLPALVP